MAIEDFTGGGKVLLAPLSGISDSPFRRICKGFGADAVYSEMISSEGLTRKNARSADLAGFTEEERPIGIQLFGKRPERMAEAARVIEEVGPDLIDINLCCPARRVVSKGGGAALLKDTRLSAGIIRAVVGATSLPVTVKIRIGWDEDSINAVEMTRIAEEEGAVAIGVHGRTSKQGFRGWSDWDRVVEVKDAARIPVILTGDIMTPEDVSIGFEATGCDAVMVARGSFGRPWIFAQAREYMETGAYTEFPIERISEVALRHLDLMIEISGERMGVLRFRKHLLWYTKGLHGVVALRRQMSNLSQKAEVAALLDRAISDTVKRRQARGEERP
jgi:nifR3 family TIM-barrel protein